MTHWTRWLAYAIEPNENVIVGWLCSLGEHRANGIGRSAAEYEAMRLPGVWDRLTACRRVRGARRSALAPTPDLAARLAAYKLVAEERRKIAKLSRGERAVRTLGTLRRALEGAEGTGRERCLSVGAVLECAKTCVSDAADSSVAKSYKYPVTYTAVSAERDGPWTAITVNRTTTWGRRGDTTRTVRVLTCELEGLCLDPRLPADAIAIGNERTATRYNQHGEKTGMALWVDGAWEHGATIVECRSEYRRKREEKARREADAAALARRTAREARRERLLSRISTTLVATLADAQALGYCRAGIESWCTARAVDPSGSLAICKLARDEDRRAQAVALYVARRAIAARSQAAAA